MGFMSESHFQGSEMGTLFPPIPLRDEKVKVLKAVPELSLSDVVLGQVYSQLYLFHLFVCFFESLGSRYTSNVVCLFL